MNAYLTSLQHFAFYQTCKILSVEVTDPISGMIARSYCDGQALYTLPPDAWSWLGSSLEANSQRNTSYQIFIHLHLELIASGLLYHFLLNRNLVWVELPRTVGWNKSTCKPVTCLLRLGSIRGNPKRRHVMASLRRGFSHLEVDAVDSVSYMGGKNTFFFCWLEEKAVSYCCLSTDLKQDSWYHWYLICFWQNCEDSWV